MQRIAALAVVLFLFAGAAGAQSTAAPASAFRPAFTVLSDQTRYDVHADGSFVYEETESVRLNDDRGVKQRSQLPLAYSTSLQDLDILEAFTVTRAGTRIDVPADSIRLQQSPLSAGAPMFDDIKVKTIVFPATEVGAVVNVRFRRTQRTPLFPGAFSMTEVFARTVDFQAAELTLRVPASMPLLVEATGVEGGERAPTETTREWHWSLRNATAQTPEIGSISAFDVSPRVSATTFSGFDAAGRAYLERARPQAAVTPTIQALADEITAGIVDKRAQAAALYQWVSRNVRYVAIFLNVGGVVPHPADEIAKARYGDCKDHVTILESLLAAKGIRSSPVLVNAGNTYSLPKVAITPGVFNHVVTFLPDFGVFVDSTAAIAPFGVLPLQERGKPALIADAGRGEASVVTLPLTDPRGDSVIVKTVLAMSGDGSVEGTSEVANSGVFDILSRAVLGAIAPGMEAQVASRILTMTGQSGSGSYRRGDGADLSKPFAYSTRFTLPDYAQWPGPGAMRVPVGLASFTGISTAFEAFAPPKRNFPMVAVSSHREETTTLSVPDGAKVSALPQPVAISTRLGHYASSYRIEGNSIVVKRTLEIEIATPTVQGDDYEVLRAMGEKVNRDLRSQIVYQ